MSRASASPTPAPAPLPPASAPAYPSADSSAAPLVPQISQAEAEVSRTQARAQAALAKLTLQVKPADFPFMLPSSNPSDAEQELVDMIESMPAGFSIQDIGNLRLPEANYFSLKELLPEGYTEFLKVLAFENGKIKRSDEFSSFVTSAMARAESMEMGEKNAAAVVAIAADWQTRKAEAGTPPKPGDPIDPAKQLAMDRLRLAEDAENQLKDAVKAVEAVGKAVAARQEAYNEQQRAREARAKETEPLASAGAPLPPSPAAAAAAAAAAAPYSSAPPMPASSAPPHPSTAAAPYPYPPASGPVSAQPASAARSSYPAPAMEPRSTSPATTTTAAYPPASAASAAMPFPLSAARPITPPPAAPRETTSPAAAPDLLQWGKAMIGVGAFVPPVFDRVDREALKKELQNWDGDMRKANINSPIAALGGYSLSVLGVTATQAGGNLDILVQFAANAKDRLTEQLTELKRSRDAAEEKERTVLPATPTTAAYPPASAARSYSPAPAMESRSTSPATPTTAAYPPASAASAAMPFPLSAARPITPPPATAPAGPLWGEAMIGVGAFVPPVFDRVNRDVLRNELVARQRPGGRINEGIASLHGGIKLADLGLTQAQVSGDLDRLVQLAADAADKLTQQQIDDLLAADRTAAVAQLAAQPAAQEPVYPGAPGGFQQPQQQQQQQQQKSLRPRTIDAQVAAAAVAAAAAAAAGAAPAGRSPSPEVRGAGRAEPQPAGPGILPPARHPSIEPTLLESFGRELDKALIEASKMEVGRTWHLTTRPFETLGNRTISLGLGVAVGDKIMTELRKYSTPAAFTADMASIKAIIMQSVTEAQLQGVRNPEPEAAPAAAAQGWVGWVAQGARRAAGAVGLIRQADRSPSPAPAVARSPSPAARRSPTPPPLTEAQKAENMAKIYEAMQGFTRNISQGESLQDAAKRFVDGKIDGKKVKDLFPYGVSRTTMSALQILMDVAEKNRTGWPVSEAQIDYCRIRQEEAQNTIRSGMDWHLPRGQIPRQPHPAAGAQAPAPSPRHPYPPQGPDDRSPPMGPAGFVGHSDVHYTPPQQYSPPPPMAAPDLDSRVAAIGSQFDIFNSKPRIAGMSIRDSMTQFAVQEHLDPTLTLIDALSALRVHEERAELPEKDRAGVGGVKLTWGGKDVTQRECQIIIQNEIKRQLQAQAQGRGARTPSPRGMR